MGEVIKLVTPQSEKFLSGAHFKMLIDTGQWKRLCRELELYDIVKVVESVTGVRLPQLRKQSRMKKFVDARHLFVLLANEHTKYSWCAMGRCIDRDHTTVIHMANREVNEDVKKALKKANKEIDTFKERVFGPPVS